MAMHSDQGSSDLDEDVLEEEVIELSEADLLQLLDRQEPALQVYAAKALTSKCQHSLHAAYQAGLLETIC